MTRLLLTAECALSTARTVAHVVACAPSVVVIVWRLVQWDVGEMRVKRRNHVCPASVPASGFWPVREGTVRTCLHMNKPARECEALR